MYYIGNPFYIFGKSVRNLSVDFNRHKCRSAFKRARQFKVSDVHRFVFLKHEIRYRGDQSGFIVMQNQKRIVLARKIDFHVVYVRDTDISAADA